MYELWSALANVLAKLSIYFFEKVKEKWRRWWNSQFLRALKNYIPSLVYTTKNYKDGKTHEHSKNGKRSH